MAADVAVPTMTSYETVAMDTQRWAADNECAQALLDLAMSSNPHQAARASPPACHKRSAQLKHSTSSDEMEYTQELTKRIKLDHNYFWAGVGSRSKTPEFSQDLINMEDLGDDVAVPCKWDKENTAKDLGIRAKVPRDTKNTQEDGLSDKRRQEATYSSSSSGVSSASSKNISNFQLLMNCLLNSEQDKAPVKSSIKSPSSQSEEESYNLLTEDVEVDTRKKDHYRCNICSSRFLSKRYLRKHIMLRHPFNLSCGLGKSMCPKCAKVMFNENFADHLLVCDGQLKKRSNGDSVACDLCGIRFKPQAMADHLSFEHGVQAVCQDVSELAGGDDDATMYPADEVAGVACPKCGLCVKKDYLQTRVALEHAYRTPGAKCSCKHSMLQTYLHGSPAYFSQQAPSSLPCEVCLKSLSTLRDKQLASPQSDSIFVSRDLSPTVSHSGSSPSKSPRGSSSTLSAEETRQHLMNLEEVAYTMLSCAHTSIHHRPSAV